ncbi:MAG TPA: CsbD family protein [Chloroflexota bacterium]|nr:CsbD family protein [Chloroflexota bacterium]
MDELKGKVKETVGRAKGDEKMVVEGQDQRAAGKVGREVGGAMDQAKGNAKMAAGKLVGNKRLHAEGQMDDAKGSLRRAG